MTEPRKTKRRYGPPDFCNLDGSRYSTPADHLRYSANARLDFEVGKEY